LDKASAAKGTVHGFKYKQWNVRRQAKQPLLDFVVEGLRESGCTILYTSDAGHAPFFITYETSEGDRGGVLVYAFLANSKVTRNRPVDEHRFQVKYGSNTGDVLPIERDPARLVTTIFVGIDVERGILVGADPTLHDGTPMFISIEFKSGHVEEVLRKGWHTWERESSRHSDEPVEALVATRRNRVLDYIIFERTAAGLDQGHRQLLAERISQEPKASGAATHALVTELGLAEQSLFDLIQQTSRLKMAVRGSVAELHLERQLKLVPGIDDCHRLNEEGKPDLSVVYKGRPQVLIECKNVLRHTTADGMPRVDFQRTRASKSDPCSRYYRPTEFALLAACLHAVTENWEFRFTPTDRLSPHRTCIGKLSSAVKVDADWYLSASDALDVVTSAR
jgi:hypothetical protein